MFFLGSGFYCGAGCIGTRTVVCTGLEITYKGHLINDKKSENCAATFMNGPYDQSTRHETTKNYI